MDFPLLKVKPTAKHNIQWFSHWWKHN